MIKFNIYDRKNQDYVKTDCTMVAIIGPGQSLTDDEVRKYFGIDEDHWNWRSAHTPARVKRYVFDKIILPAIPRYEIQQVVEDSDE